MSRVRNNIRKIRLNLGLSQVELAELLSTSQSQVQKLEMGDRRLTVEWLSRLARALHCQFGDLIDLDALHADQDDADHSNAVAKEGQALFRAPYKSAKQDMIPLFGSVDDKQLLKKENRLKKIARHPSQAGTADAFAIEVSNDDMAPRYRKGDIAYAVVGIMPSPGDDVVVEQADGRVFLAEYAGASKNEAEISFQMGKEALTVSKKQIDIKTLSIIVGRG